jgi:hypothetical protein
MPNVEARLTVLELGHAEMTRRLDHMDESLDKQTEQAAVNAELTRKNAETWDGRWKLGIGIVIGVALATGSGVVSLKSIIELLSKIAH